MSDALKSQGIVIKRGDGGAPELFTAIAEINSFSGLGGGSAADIDVTHFGSTAKEYLVGLPDEGEVTIEGNFIPSDGQQAGLWADRAAQTLRNFKIELTDSPATVFSFSAFVKSFSISAGTDDKIACSLTLRVSGQVTMS